MSKTLHKMSEILKQQVENAASANDLICGHKGKCSHCPVCKRFHQDDFPEIKFKTEETIEEKEEVFFKCLLF